MTRTEILLRDEKRTLANGEADGGIDRGTFILWRDGVRGNRLRGGNHLSVCVPDKKEWSEDADQPGIWGEEVDVSVRLPIRVSV